MHITLYYKNQKTNIFDIVIALVYIYRNFGYRQIRVFSWYTSRIFIYLYDHNGNCDN